MSDIYIYEFQIGGDDRTVTYETGHPMAAINAGTFVQLADSEFGIRPDKHLLIEKVEAFILSKTTDSHLRQKIVVSCRVADRTR